MAAKERIVIGGNGGAHVYVAHKIAQVKDDDAVIRPVQIFETAIRGGRLNVRVAPPRHPATKE